MLPPVQSDAGALGTGQETPSGSGRRRALTYASLLASISSHLSAAVLEPEVVRLCRIWCTRVVTSGRPASRCFTR